MLDCVKEPGVKTLMSCKVLNNTLIYQFKPKQLATCQMVTLPRYDAGVAFNSCLVRLGHNKFENQTTACVIYQSSDSCVDDSGRWGRGGLFTALEVRSDEPRKQYELAGKMKGKIDSKKAFYFFFGGLTKERVTKLNMICFRFGSWKCASVPN